MRKTAAFCVRKLSNDKQGMDGDLRKKKKAKEKTALPPQKNRTSELDATKINPSIFLNLPTFLRDWSHRVISHDSKLGVAMVRKYLRPGG